MKEKKVLFFGSYPGLITGQSLSFREVYSGFSGEKILVNSIKFNNNKFLNSIYCLLILPYYFVFYRFEKVYFICTRSKLGFFKDLELLFLCKLFDKNVINHLHGADFASFYENSGILKKLIKWAYLQIDTTIVLLPTMAEQFAAFPKMKIKVVANAYPTEYLKIKINISNKKKQILYLSNIIETKGVIVFLEAMKTILNEYSDVIVKIAGSPMGDEISSLKTIENRFNQYYSPLKEKYPDRIFYLGSIVGLTKAEVLEESSIFVLPTYYKTEAFPLSIIEAMRFGNAIITTNHNYLSDVINDDNGFLIQVKSVVDCELKLRYLLADNEKLQKIQRFNINSSLEKYSPLTFNRQINNIINQN